MAGFPDLQNPQVQQGLRDTFSDPSLGRAVAQAIPSGSPSALGGDPQALWDKLRWTYNFGKPTEQQLGADTAQFGNFGVGEEATSEAMKHPFLQGFMGGLEDTQPQLKQWLQNYKPFKPNAGQVSAWV